MKSLITALMVWASAQTGLPVPDTLPEVRKADRCEIEQLYYADGSIDCDSVRMRIVALYDPAIKTMYLPNEWEPDSLYHVSVLLHELVHHMQTEAGITFETVACSGEQIEKPAYDAQIAFLEAAGVEAMDVMGINALAYVFLTRCFPG